MSNEQKVSVKTSETLVGLGQSKRLAAMRQSIVETNSVDLGKNQKRVVTKKGQEIQRAQVLIRNKVVAIKSRYPQGKQEKLFALRYASEEKLQQMTLRALFSLLEIKDALVKEIADEVANLNVE